MRTRDELDALAADLPLPEKRELVHYPWRVGRSLGRTIYADICEDPNGHIVIGMMDTPELAQAACNAHNEWLERDG